MDGDHAADLAREVDEGEDHVDVDRAEVEAAYRVEAGALQEYRPRRRLLLRSLRRAGTSS